MQAVKGACCVRYDLSVKFLIEKRLVGAGAPSPRCSRRPFGAVGGLGRGGSVGECCARARG
jgi:hypothetical protein